MRIISVTQKVVTKGVIIKGVYCNKNDTTAASWLIIMIGPGGLLLVVPPPVSVSWLGLQESKYLNLDVKNTFLGLHTEHYSECS